MKHNIESHENTKTTKRTPARLGAGAVGLTIAAASLHAGSASAGQLPPKSWPVPPNVEKILAEQASRIQVQETLVSQEIGEQIPVTFINGIANVQEPNARAFSIFNPLIVETPDNTTLIGEIERKGGPTGPAIVLFPMNSETVSILPNTDSPANMPYKNEVIFPGMDYPFNTSNPVNPANGEPYLYPQGNSFVIGAAVPDKE